LAGRICGQLRPWPTPKAIKSDYRRFAAKGANTTDIASYSQTPSKAEGNKSEKQERWLGGSLTRTAKPQPSAPQPAPRLQRAKAGSREKKQKKHGFAPQTPLHDPTRQGAEGEKREPCQIVQKRAQARFCVTPTPDPESRATGFVGGLAAFPTRKA